MPFPSVTSEVGRLQAVLVHRPDIELARITPSNKDELLFDELVWVERAQEEHDAFVDIIRRSGAEALYVERLLAEVLADDDLRTATIADHANDHLCGPQMGRRVRAFLADLPVDELVRHLIGGVTVAELSGPTGLVGALLDPSDFVLPPLPNTVFMRDSSVWVGEGVVLSPMNRPVRQRETELLRLLYEHHPRFSHAPTWLGAEPGLSFPATIEGGDLLILGEDAVAVGVSERTTPQGAANLAARLFAGPVRRMLVVELPRARSTMHLDTVVTMVDVDTFLVYPKLEPLVRCLQVAPDGDAIAIEEAAGLHAGLAWAVGVDKVEVIAPALDSIQADREQWNDANNTFALAPGEVVAYERNVATNQTLAEAGITVHTMPSSELPRGRGGPRCMTCPVAREPIVR